MTAKEWHTVNGTLFGFPELPTPDEMGEALHAKFTAANQSILDKAAAVKHRPAPKPRAWKGPKPGDGTFEPKPGDPGSSVTVTIRVYEYDRDPGNPYAEWRGPCTTVERDGCVMFPAPRGVWVSLWDGRNPFAIGRDEAAGERQAELRMSRAEYEDRFGPIPSRELVTA